MVICDSAPPVASKPSVAGLTTAIKLAVVSCHFGLAGFRRPQANIRRFVRQMEREGVPVYGIEAFVNEASCADLGWPSIRLEDEQILWQKEALLNLAVRRVPKEYNAVAWIDPDVWFTNPHWRAQAEDRLRDHDAVQLFERACWTAEDGQIDMTRRCAAGVAGGSGHPGFGWALRRDMWPLPDWYCTGSGDQDMAREWKKNFRVSHVLGDCVHEFHGRRSDRQYYERHLWRQGIPAKDCVVRAANGLMEWSPAAPQSLRAAMKNYFLTRKEDG